MIESIEISDVATYEPSPQFFSGLAKFNYVFGSNGTGKTTVSRVIADASKHPSCKVTWQAGSSLDTMVYNCDFVERNFSQSSELKGVFTLGEQQVDTLSKIATATTRRDQLSARVDRLNVELNGSSAGVGKRAELEAIDSAFKDKCWRQKQKHDDKLQGAFEGYRNNAEKFKEKVLAESASSSGTSGLSTLSELELAASKIFGMTPTREQIIAAIETSALIQHEKDPILTKCVIGSDDVDISAMIKSLGNSDWIREGRAFYERNNGHCPFCQQTTATALAQSLREYFNDEFAADSSRIQSLRRRYEIDARSLLDRVRSIIGSPPRFLDSEALTAAAKLLDATVTINLQRLEEKQREAARVATLDSHAAVLSKVCEIIDAANAAITIHNRTVENLAHERAALTSQAWRFIVEELRPEINAYSSARGNVNQAIVAMTGTIEAAAKDRSAVDIEIRDLEKQATSVQPTITGINALLKGFGFQGFQLAQAASGSSYQLVRNDGSDAKLTLSEGEKTFVTFLYFYHLVKGSYSDSGMTTNRVVVFDDPVSSLDSDVLFIVSSLIKTLIDEVRSSSGNVKQVFVLTHNIYFHKEVTYSSKRTKTALKDEGFWIIRKPGDYSKIEKHDGNPIKTSYELLWQELRKTGSSNLSIQNTLRRILENYFKLLGGIGFDELSQYFDGTDKTICKSLCAWMHDGSHFAHDDLYVSIGDAMVSSYLRVFRAIFDKSGHLAHYRMMMGDAFTEEVPSAPGAETEPVKGDAESAAAL